MPDAWVVNASPLIILSRINRLDFLKNLAPAPLIPAAVIAEVSAGLHSGRQGTGQHRRVIGNKPNDY